jgi:hypothetical protein
MANMIMQETAKYKQEEQNEQLECFAAQSPNSNYTSQPPTPQRIYLRQPQLTTAPMSKFFSFLKKKKEKFFFYIINKLMKK